MGQDAPELGKQGKSDNDQLGEGSLLSTRFQTGSREQLNATWEVTRRSEECWVVAGENSPLSLILNNAGPLNPAWDEAGGFLQATGYYGIIESWS